ncbi:hypothetical protein C8A05DRAFT_43225 [Staphylotrichum tortipilum]|uniref:Methyltransferase domain-containing protein n=1 Tax=Staphylotrichum tortipilum TaxID=2831512 RepID=A0AAN6MP87_9PEZI|nr:hypothetical protein C8A05DRAFT_43225 [Staphylotrichum longicolle]
MPETVGRLYEREEAFWDTYRVGRPTVPDSFFARIFDYHAAKGPSIAPNQPHPTFNLAHDAGAGDGLHAPRLRARFGHVIVSDVAPGNISLAREHLAEANDGANMLHLVPSQQTAVAALARQLRPGGTLAVAAFGPARFPQGSPLAAVWKRFRERLGEGIIQVAEGMAGYGGGERLDAALETMKRITGWYNVAPLDGGMFEDGVMRVRINAGEEGLLGLWLVPERLMKRAVAESCVGEKDVIVWEEDEGWCSEMDADGVKAQFESFNIVSAVDDELVKMYEEVDMLLPADERVRVTFYCELILATRRFDA